MNRISESGFEPSQQIAIESQKNNIRATSQDVECYFADFQLDFAGWMKEMSIVSFKAC